MSGKNIKYLEDKMKEKILRNMRKSLSGIIVFAMLITMIPGNGGTRENIYV